MKILLLVIAAVLCFLAHAFSETVKLAWDASAGPDVSGYRIYWGFAPGHENHVHPVEAGMNLTVTIDEPWSPGTVVWFDCVAFNSIGIESLPSNEIFYQVPIPTPTPSPIPVPTPSATPTPPPPTPIPTPAPPQNLRQILEQIAAWLRDLWLT